MLVALADGTLAIFHRSEGIWSFKYLFELNYYSGSSDKVIYVNLIMINLKKCVFLWSEVSCMHVICAHALNCESGPRIHTPSQAFKQ